jgi:hypothetical protein
MESSLDGRNGALDLYIHAIAGAANDREAVGLRESESRRHSLAWLGPNRSVNSGTVRKCR